MKLTLILIIIGVILISIVAIAQTQTGRTAPNYDLKNDCYTIKEVHESIEPILEGKKEICNVSCTCGKNCAIVNVWSDKRIAVPYYVNKTICKQKVNQVDMLLEAYNCDTINGSVVCDSCYDGNCDGICSPLGGETCCKINLDGSTICKNGVVEWKEAQILPVNKLSVTK